MTTAMIILATLGSLAGVVLLTIMWAIAKYNSFVRLKVLIDEAWSGIDVQLKRRYDLIPNLVSTVKGYSVHEKETLENIAKFRTAAMTAHSVTDKADAESALTNSLKSLFAVAESYPELKANENYMHLQKELSTIEQEVQLSRRYYNGTVRGYNTAIATFPASMIAGASGFTPAVYFELTNQQERNVPNVEF